MQDTTTSNPNQLFFHSIGPIIVGETISAKQVRLSAGLQVWVFERRSFLLNEAEAQESIENEELQENEEATEAEAKTAGEES